MVPSKETQEFVQADQVTLIHIIRYNSQIHQLLQVQDYSEQDLVKGAVSRTEFYRARENKIRAYSDCINTLSQKEKLLQFHSSGFEIEFIKEKTEVKQARAPWDVTKLSFEEQVELYGLIKKARTDEVMPLPITQANNIEEVKTEDAEFEEIGKLNVELIKHEELPESPQLNKMPARDPTIKLRESLERLAAKRFKEAGGTLTEEEEQLLREIR